MDHADVLERLATAFLEPGQLESLETDNSAEGQELRRHLENCDACRLELEAWRLTSEALALATPDSFRAPPEARDRVLATVAAMGVARGGAGTAFAAAARPARSTAAPAPPTAALDGVEPSGAWPSTSPAPRLTAMPGGSGGAARANRPDTAFAGEGSHPSDVRKAVGTASRPPRRWLALAAVLAVLLFAGGALLGARLGASNETAADDLAQVVTAMDGIIEQPDHVTVTLHTADGRPGGSVVLDPGTGNLAIVSTALVPASTQTYDCFIVRGTDKIEIGLMHFSDQTSYWIGRVGSLTNPGHPGDTFEVRLGGTTGVLSLSGNF